MNRLQDKLDFLLEKYSVDVRAEFKDDKTVLIDGTEIPLLSHRFERRFVELKNIVNNGTLFGISVMRVARIAERGASTDEILCRELDLCQWILGDKIKSVMEMRNDNTLNVIAVTKKGIVCTIEISATLKKGEAPIDKHEIISQRGIACDVVVDAQLKQNSIYLFSDENDMYTDVDYELYGLEIEEIAAVRAAFAISQSKNFKQVIDDNDNIKILLAATEKSVKTGERVVIE